MTERFLIVLGALIAGVVSPAPASAADCPVGHEVVIDNGEPGYSETGDDWTSWQSGGQSAGSTYRYLSHTVGGSDRKGTATWSPSLPVAGHYRVEAVFRATVNRSSDADYFVHDATGKVTHKSVDQRDGSTEGNSHGPVYKNLGTFSLAPGKGHVVLDGTDDNLSDEADAVVFTLVSCDGAPPPAAPAPTGACAGIAANADFELCESTATRCAGVFTAGNGCAAFCAAAGMRCVAQHGGEPGCQKEAIQHASCDRISGHKSDWCECELLTQKPDPAPTPQPPPATDPAPQPAPAPEASPAPAPAPAPAAPAPEPALELPEPWAPAADTTGEVVGGCQLAPTPDAWPPLLLALVALGARRRR